MENPLLLPSSLPLPWSAKVPFCQPPPSARRLSCFFIRCSFGVFFVCVYAPFLPPRTERTKERSVFGKERGGGGERGSVRGKTERTKNGEGKNHRPRRPSSSSSRSFDGAIWRIPIFALLLFPPLLGFSSSVAIMCIHTAPPPPPPLFVPPPEQGCSGEERERDRPTSIYSCVCRRRRTKKRKERERLSHRIIRAAERRRGIREGEGREGRGSSGRLFFVRVSLWLLCPAGHQAEEEQEEEENRMTHIVIKGGGRNCADAFFPFLSLAFPRHLQKMVGRSLSPSHSHRRRTHVYIVSSPLLCFASSSQEK